MNKRYWSSRIENMEAYVPGEQPKDKKYIKLNTNENPYPPSPKVWEAISEVKPEELRLYPDPECLELRTLLAQQRGLNPDQVFVGNGSDEVLAFSYLAFMDDETPAVFPDITYSFYPVYAAFFGNNARIVPVAEDFALPLEEFKKNDGTLIITNPNAPTGIAIEPDQIGELCRANPDHVVIVDEAYVDFGGKSVVPLLKEFENLLVIQTYSKARSLAGMRIGFAYGSEDLIAALNTVKNSINSYTLDRVALAAATASARDEAYTYDICRRVAETRENTAGKLAGLGFRVLPSRTNFLFVSHRTVPAAELFRELRAKGVLVRYFNKPRIDNFLRITIGTDEEMEAMLTAMAEILEEYNG